MRNLLLSRMEKMKTMMSWGNKDNDVWTKTFLLVAIDSLRSFFFLFPFQFLEFRLCVHFTLQRFSFSFYEMLPCNFSCLPSWRKRLRGALYIIFFIIIFFCTLFVVIIFGKRDESPKEWCKKHDRKQLRQKAPS